MLTYSQLRNAKKTRRLGRASNSFVWNPTYYRKSYKSNLFAPFKAIHDSRGFWIPPCGFRIPSTGFRIPAQWIPIFFSVLMLFFAFRFRVRILLYCSFLIIQVYSFDCCIIKYWEKVQSLPGKIELQFARKRPNKVRV